MKNIAVVSVGVTAQGNTVSQVQQQLNQKMNAVTGYQANANLTIWDGSLTIVRAVGQRPAQL